MSKRPLRPFFVMSPEYEAGGMYEPPEPTRDIVEVEARTKREAKVAGVRAMRGDRNCEWHRYWAVGENPYKGIRVELAACSHGNWEHRCAECDAEPICANCGGEGSHPRETAEIRARLAAGEPAREIAADYRTSEANVDHIGDCGTPIVR